MEKIPLKQKKQKGICRENLLNTSIEELADRVIQLEAHNVQLKNIISKNLHNDSNVDTNAKKSFDFTKCHYRRILLRIMYFGWNYQGLAVQEDSIQTIEHYLFQALTKACLIQARETSQYQRCGRTDKGVSSFGQVISITVRSKHPPNCQMLSDSIASELPYCKVLNRLLPKDIRAVAWMPLTEEMPDYSARFNCTKRQYKYYFPRSSLDIAAMRRSCQYLIGSHDFRHLCKMDVGNGVTEFIRNIIKAEILAVEDKNHKDPTSMCYLLIEGNAFLWHQIRCIMGVLLLVGQGKESPDIIAQLLDVNSNPRKPQYNMALDIPLNLFHCSYDTEEHNDWIYDKDELKTLISHIQNEWTIHSIKTTMIKDSLQELETQYAKLTRAKEITHTLIHESEERPRIDESGSLNTSEKHLQNMCETEDMVNSTSERIMAHTDCLLQGVKPKVYTPLMKRETCSSLEERVEYYRKKRKIDNNEISNIIVD